MSPKIFEKLRKLTPEELAYAAAIDQEVADWLDKVKSDGGFLNFVPRPDDPANLDQQESFCRNRDPLSILIGGNAAGTTEAGAYKTAQFLLHQQPPPRKDTPFWILSNTYEQVGGAIWKEKLVGHGHLPMSEVEWDRVTWRDKKQGHPAIVPLKPWAKEKGGEPGKNWAIHFKSFEQGREALQAASIGGFFFSEQFPLEILIETLRGCREYMFPGGQFCEFTPIDPDLCLWVEKAMDEPPPGWKFYRCNTAKNRHNLAAGWFDSFFATVSDEMLQTRLTGELATFAGAIFQSFNPHVHVIPMEPSDIPPGCRHAIGSDWGSSAEHPHVTVFGAEDNGGTWYIYDCYFTRDQTKIVADHARAVVAIGKKWGWPTIKRMAADGVIYEGFQTDDFHGMNYADPSRPGSIVEFSYRGIPTAPASNAVYEGINHVRSLFKIQPHTDPPAPRLYIAKHIVEGLEQLRKYRWKPGKKNVGGGGLTPAAAAPVPLKREDDFPDALRYLLYSCRNRPVITPRDVQRNKNARDSIQAITESSRGVQIKRRGR